MVQYMLNAVWRGLSCESQLRILVHETACVCDRDKASIGKSQTSELICHHFKCSKKNF